MVVYFVDWRKIEFFKFSPRFETNGVERTGPLSFFPAELPEDPTPGFRMYLAFRLASRLESFGFRFVEWKVPKTIESFVGSRGCHLIRAGNGVKPDIYRCRLNDGHEVVIKKHLAKVQYQAEVETLTKLSPSKYLPDQ